MVHALTMTTEKRASFLTDLCRHLIVVYLRDSPGNTGGLHLITVTAILLAIESWLMVMYPE